MTQREKRIEEAKKNFAFYKTILTNLDERQHGKYLLLKDSKVIEYYDDIESANIAANSMFPDKLFSIQKVAQKPADLGFYRYANFRNA